MIDRTELDRTAASIRALYDAQLYRDARGLARRVAAELPEPTAKVGAEEVRARAHLARTLALVGEGRWARIQLDRAIAATERTLGPRHPELASLLIAQAEVISQLVYYPQLEPLCKRADEICEVAHGADHAHTARAQLAWAELVIRHWHPYLARPLARRARATLEPVAGSLDPVVLRARELLALAGKGTTPPARLAEELTDLLALRERVQGPMHPDLVRLLEPAIEIEPETDGAARAHERARKILVKVHDESHPHVALVDVLMAERWMRVADTSRALPFLESALSKLEAAWELDHPDRMPVYGRLTMLMIWVEGGPEMDALKGRLRALKDLEKK